MPGKPATLAWGLFALLLAVGGCGGGGENDPKTYPVAGKVVLKNGQPVAGGLVEFRSVNEPSLTTMGEIQADGSFSLTTVVGKRKLPGAVEGAYHVTVIPKSDNPTAQPIRLPRPVTVKPEENNNLVITLPLSRLP